MDTANADDAGGIKLTGFKKVRATSVGVVAGILVTSTAISAVAEAVKSGSNRSIRGGMELEEPTFPLQARLSLVRVPYVTNRDVDIEAIAQGHASGENGGFEAVFKNKIGTSPSYGIAFISSPINRKSGQDTYADGPRRENPFQNIAFWHYVAYPSDTALKAACERALPPGADRKAFLYVHGLDNSFSDAVERLAQLVIDLGGNVVPLAFSWPSDIGRTVPDRAKSFPLPTDYRLAHATAERSMPDLGKAFQVAASLDRDVRLLAHSMGAFVVDGAVAGLLGKGKPKADLFSAVAFAAPDVGLDNFLASGLPTMLRLTRRLTVYCSDDYALAMSSIVNGGNRLGRCPRVAPALSGAKVVQVVGGIADFSRHSYFLSSAKVIEHLRAQLLAPPAAGLVSAGRVDNKTVIDVDK